MNKKILLDKLLNYFIKNKKDIPEKLEDKIKLWKEIRLKNDCSDIPKEILEAEDMYLRFELLNKKLTDASKVKTIGEEFVKNIRYSDYICIWYGDITKIYADSVVRLTSFDKLTKYNTKIDNIELYSGMRLKKKCNDALGDSKLNVSEVLITRAFNLPCDYILHVLEPDGRSKDYDRFVKAVYTNVLDVAKNNMIRSVVIPCVGLQKKDKEKYIDLMLDTIYEFLDKYHQIMNTRIIINVNEEVGSIIKKKLMEKVEK